MKISIEFKIINIIEIDALSVKNDHHIDNLATNGQIYQLKDCLYDYYLDFWNKAKEIWSSSLEIFIIFSIKS